MNGPLRRWGATGLSVDMFTTTTRVLLHIGTAKTGTTSIQTCLAQNRDKLAKKKIYYPKLELGFSINHRALIPAFNPAAAGENLVVRMGGEAASRKESISQWAAVRDRVQVLRPRLLVISAEQLIDIGPIGLGSLLRELSSISPSLPKAIAYVRAPADHYLSAAQQLLRGGDEIRWPQKKYFAESLKTWRRALGENLVVRKFEAESMSEGSVVSDFLLHANLQECGISRKSQVRNVSLSAEAMSVLERLKGKRVGAIFLLDKNRAIVDRLRALDQEVPSPTKAQLRGSWTDYINSICTDLKVLRDEFDLEFSGVDYSEVGSPLLEAPAPMRELSVDSLCDFSAERRDLLERMLFR